MSFLSETSYKINIGKIIRFMIVGTLTAIIYAGTLAAILSMHLINATASTAIAYIFAITFNYWMHHRWTFKCDRSHGASIPRYILSIMPIYGLLIVVTEWLPQKLNTNFVWIQIIFFVLITIINFILQSLFTFTTPRRQE
jgi:putative flippase GtrA